MILASGKPAYVVAGEVGISYNRLLDYADGRASLAHAHEVRLVRYFGSPIGERDSSERLAGAHAFEDGVEFLAVVRGARAVPRADVVVTLLVNQTADEWDVVEAWRLAGASGVTFLVCAFEPITRRLQTGFSASVEDVKVRPGAGLEVRLRVPHEERDSVLGVSWSSAPRIFRLAVLQPHG
jgi:hypothetical protein